jgi:hypothetical protein
VTARISSSTALILLLHKGISPLRHADRAQPIMIDGGSGLRPSSRSRCRHGRLHDLSSANDPRVLVHWNWRRTHGFLTGGQDCRPPVGTGLVSGDLTREVSTGFGQAVRTVGDATYHRFTRLGFGQPLPRSGHPISILLALTRHLGSHFLCCFTDPRGPPRPRDQRSR